MKVSNLGDFVGGVLTIALITTIVSHKGTATSVKAIGSTATSFMRTAMTGK